ncbi:MAG: tetratricopeptide repeat protein [Planctomycetes bacterium]|nr:tetratricopeptide repeat protein [Planctomycetota bacterium]
MATPDDVKEETLLNIGQGSSSSARPDHGETLLNLDGSPSNESVLQRVARLAGEVPATISESATPLPPQTIQEIGSDARTAPGSADKAGRDSAKVSDKIAQLSAGASKSRYATESELGAGGMGIVLRTRDNDLRRHVAMKVIRRERLKPGTPEGINALRRFIEEAQITGQLEHPNIVPVHELGADTVGRPYFTMKLVKGRALSDILKGLRQCDQAMLREYPLDRLLQILLKVCDALSFAHAHGVLHRDLKPDNIMVGDFGEVVVMDWGLARILDKAEYDTATVETDDASRRAAPDYEPSTHSMEGMIAGTPAYMAPEQARGEISRLEQRTDIFALGALLYDMLVLRPPYAGKGSELIELAQRCEIPPPAIRITQDHELYRAAGVRFPGRRFPPELAAIALHAMNERIERRYASAKAMAADIENYLAGRPVSVRRDPLRIRVAKWVRRHPTLAMTTSVGLIALFVGTAAILAIVADAQRKEARQQQQLAATSADREQQANLRAEAESDLKDKQAALLRAEKERSEALERRTRAEQLFRQGALHAERAREISNDQLQAKERTAAESTLGEAIDADPTYIEPVFALARLLAFFDDERALDRFLQVDRMSREHGGKGDARALVYAGDFQRVNRGDNDAARKFYEAASKVAPNDPLALVGRGYLELIAENYKGARELAQAAHKVDDSLWEPVALEGQVRLNRFKRGDRVLNADYDVAEAARLFSEAQQRTNREGSIYKGRGSALLALWKVEEAEQDFRRACELLPADVSAGAGLAACLRAQYRFDAAREVIEPLVDQQSVEDVSASIEYGGVLLALREPHEATEVFLEALDRDPGRPSLLCGLAEAAMQVKNYSDASNWLRQALKSEPAFFRAHCLQARFHEVLKRVDEALVSADAGLGIQPGDPVLTALKARLLARAGKTEVALTLATRVVDDYPRLDCGFVALGFIHQRRRTFETAAGHYRSAIALNGGNAEARAGLAVVLRLSGRIEEALRCGRVSADLSPEDPEPWLEMAQCHLELKQWREALESYREAVELGDSGSDTFTTMSQCATDLGLRADALKYAQRATEVRPQNVLAWVRLGDALVAEGRRSDAANALERARGLPWTEPNERAEVGAALLRLADAAAARDVAENLTATRPDFVRGWMLQAECYDRLGRPDDAIASYQRASVVDSLSAAPQESLSEMYFFEQRYADAVVAAREGLRRDPSNVRCLYFLGAARLSLGEYALAAENLEIAARLRPYEPQIWIKLATACINLNRYADAAQHLQECVRLEPAADEAWKLLAICRKELGNVAAACAAITKSLELYETSAESHIVAAEIYNDSGDAATAAKHARRATVLDPNAPGGWYQLGVARYALKEFEEALTAFGNAAKFAPDTGTPLYGRASALLELKRYAEAEEAGLKAAAAESLPIIGGKVIAAAALHKQGKTDAALAMLRQALPDLVDRKWAYGLEHFADLKDNAEFKKLQQEFPPR